MAKPDVHREAALRQQLRTITDAEVAAQQLDDALGCAGVGERPPSQRPLRGVSGVDDARMLVVGQGDEGVRLVVLQHRVVAGLVLPDQLPLQNQGVARALGHDEVDPVRVLD